MPKRRRCDDSLDGTNPTQAVGDKQTSIFRFGTIIDVVGIVVVAVVGSLVDADDDDDDE